MQFNINNEVRIQLTDLGRTIHRQNFEKLLPDLAYEPPIEDADGWSSWQLWKLAHEFGAHLYNGCDPPFKSCIEIPEKGTQ
jgi:hypothetical protein